MVNDHLVTCFRHDELAAGKKLRKPRLKVEMTATAKIVAGYFYPRLAANAVVWPTASTLLDPLPLRSTSKSPISPTDWRGSPAGTARPSGAHIFSVWQQHTSLVEAVKREQTLRARCAASGSRQRCTTRRNMSSVT